MQGLETATWWRQGARTAVLLVGLSVCAATSNDYAGELSVERVEVRGEVIVAFDDGYAKQSSIDGGRTWTPLANEDAPLGLRQLMKPGLCLREEPGRCLRLVLGAVEEQVSGGDWVLAFALPPEAGIGRRDVTSDGCFDSHDLDHTFLGMLEVSGPAGSTVVVAMGSEGALVREPNGQWHQVAVGTAIPVQDTIPDGESCSVDLIPWWIILVPVVFGVIAGVVTIAVVVSGNRRRRRVSTLAARPWPPPPPPR